MKTKDEDVKKYSLSKEEQADFKRIISTMGFFQVALQGLEYSLQIKQSQIEASRAVGKAPEGYRLQSRIDMEAGQLLVRKVKIEAPEKEEAAKGDSAAQAKIQKEADEKKVS